MAKNTDSLDNGNVFKGASTVSEAGIVIARQLAQMSNYAGTLGESSFVSDNDKQNALYGLLTNSVNSLLVDFQEWIALP